MDTAKKSVHDFWDDASCGEALYLPEDSAAGYVAQARQRYALEPYIEDFAGFAQASGRRVLEIGVGLGADHQRFAEAGARLWGVDLTSRAVEHTRKRLQALGLSSQLVVGDAENLAFPAAGFDVVYSWGVLHHSPDTAKAVGEVWRVLAPGGVARIMIYHKWSLIGYMLWLRYALLRFKPWTTLEEIYARYLESPGTKAYTIEQAKALFSRFSKVEVRTVLTHGDLLESGAGQRHRGAALSVARRLWPRRILKRFAAGHGLFMLISASK